MSSPEPDAGADIRVVPYEQRWADAYRALAERVWGPGCRQVDPGYLRWVDKNPCRPPAGRSAIWLGVHGDAVVGCIHAMRLPWRVSDELIEFPSLHDWLVAPEFRTGLGTMLLSTAFRGERHAFIPAADGELAEVYRALRCEPVESSWFRQVLRPASGALRFGLQRGLQRVRPERVDALPRPRLRRPQPRRYSDSRGDFQLVVGADAELQAALLERLRETPREGAGAWPEWTPESFAWRFFDPDGPWHLVLYEARGAQIESFALLSVGVRHNLGIGRLMEAAFADAPAFERLARAAERALAELGVHVLLAFTLSPRERVAFARAGWRLREGPPSFFHHFPRRQRFGVVAAGAAIADFGFESMLERERLL